MREFETGATRDNDQDKYDYEGFLSPAVLERYAEYMHSHRKQADGKMRDSDNWQKGIPISAYMKSMWRHFVDVWRGYRGDEIDTEDALCALLFNVMGYLHEHLKRHEPDCTAVQTDPEPHGCPFTSIDDCTKETCTGCAVRDKS
jgi:hypothetical protein